MGLLAASLISALPIWDGSLGSLSVCSGLTLSPFQYECLNSAPGDVENLWNLFKIPIQL